MDQFLVDINRQLFYMWASKYQNNVIYAQETKEVKRVDIETNDFISKIFFWQSGIVEEEVTDKKKQECIFYLHYQFQNFLQAKKLFEEMLTFVLHSKKQKLSKVLLCCSGGLTTTLFANGLQEYATLSKQNITFDAVGYAGLYEVANNYDMILLAPQVAYLEAPTKAMINSTICCIKPIYFATNDYDKTLSMVIDTLKREEVEYG